MATTTLTVPIVSTALRNANGNLSAAAAALGISRTQLAIIINHRVSLRRLRYELDQARFDRVEAKLFELIEEGDIRALIFFLKIKGGARGYGEGTAGGGKNATINVISAVPRPPAIDSTNTNSPDSSDDDSNNDRDSSGDADAGV